MVRRANAEREAKAKEKTIEQLKVSFHATYSRAVAKRSAQMDSLWQSSRGLRENIGGDSGPYKVLTDSSYSVEEGRLTTDVGVRRPVARCERGEGLVK